MEQLSKGHRRCHPKASRALVPKNKALERLREVVRQSGQQWYLLRQHLPSTEDCLAEVWGIQELDFGRFKEMDHRHYDAREDPLAPWLCSTFSTSMNTRDIRLVVRCPFFTARLKYGKPRVNTVSAVRLAESCTQAKGVEPVVELLAVGDGTRGSPDSPSARVQQGGDPRMD